MTLYGQRIGKTYEDEHGRYIHEVDAHHAYRTGAGGRGLWRIDYGPRVPGGFREHQVEGDAQFEVCGAEQFRRRLGSWATPPAVSGYEVAIEVRRSDSGTYEIPGAAEPEDWHEVRTNLHDPAIDDYGALKGWEPWERVVCVVGVEDTGPHRWYFLAREWPTTLATRLLGPAITPEDT